MGKRRALPPAKILFRPKAVSTDPRLTDAGYHGNPNNGPTIGAALVKAARVHSTDYSLPRYVAGESKAIKAEGFYADCLWSQRMLEREQDRRY